MGSLSKMILNIRRNSAQAELQHIAHPFHMQTMWLRSFCIEQMQRRQVITKVRAYDGGEFRVKFFACKNPHR